MPTVREIARLLLERHGADRLLTAWRLLWAAAALAAIAMSSEGTVEARASTCAAGECVETSAPSVRCDAR